MFLQILLTILMILLSLVPLWTAVHAWRKNFKVIAVLIGVGYLFIPVAVGIAALAIFFVKPWHPNMEYIPNPRSVMGWGTKFYCSSDRSGDSFVTTQWFIVFYIPVLPIQSYRIALGQENTKFQGYAITTSRSFMVYEVIKLQPKHIFKLYGFILAYILVIVLFIVFAKGVPEFTHMLTSTIGGFTVIFLIIGYFLLRAK
jgi:hypothetical protein